MPGQHLHILRHGLAELREALAHGVHVAAGKIGAADVACKERIAGKEQPAAQKAYRTGAVAGRGDHLKGKVGVNGDGLAVDIGMIRRCKGEKPVARRILWVQPHPGARFFAQRFHRAHMVVVAVCEQDVRQLRAVLF